MRAGNLQRRIVLERKTLSARDAYGNPNNAWVMVDTIFADVRDGSQPDGTEAAGAGGETDTGGKVVSLLTSTFSIRYRDDITINGSTRIRYNGLIYNIKSVAMVGRRDRMILTAQAENN